jgi:YegS/Rv2252/BmrU family lipid kinase
VNNEVKKVLFIVNKFAGTGYKPELEGKILDACNLYNVECTIEYTQRRAHASELAQDAQQRNFSLVVAVGGDGTVNEVAKGLLNSSVPMGIIPRGSGNGLARHLGIPMKITEALDSLFNSRVISMDTCTFNGHLSINVSGIGFDGHIANLFGELKNRGLAGYVKLALSEFIRFKPLNASLIADGKHYQRNVFIIAIANSSQYGNNAKIAPGASVCDQYMNITLLKKVPAYRLDFIYALFRGNISNSRYCETLQASTLTISVQQPVAYHIDGEPSGVADTFNIVLNPACLKITIPDVAGSKP